MMAVLRTVGERKLRHDRTAPSGSAQREVAPKPWSNTSVALKDPLNNRQVEVLRWISEGCPDGRWTDFTYKVTALALQSRRLVEVSKRGGAWSASTSPAGDHYLVNGCYPSGHWTKRSGAIVDLDGPVLAEVD